jgi:hypothetical protein
VGLKKHSPGCNCCGGCYIIQRQGGTGLDEWDLADDFTVTGTYAQSANYLNPVSGLVAISAASDNDPDRFFFTVSGALAGDRYELYVAYVDASNYLRIDVEYEAPGGSYKGFNTVKFYQVASGVESQIGSTHNFHHHAGNVTFEGCYTDAGYSGSGEVRCSIYPEGYDQYWTAGRNTVYSFSEAVTTSGTKVGMGFPVIADSRTIDVFAIGWAYHKDEKSQCPACGMGCETNDWEVNFARRQHHDEATFDHVFENIDGGTTSNETDTAGTFRGVNLDGTLEKYIAYSESADCDSHNVRVTLQVNDHSVSPATTRATEVCLITDYFDEDNYHYGLMEYNPASVGTVMLSVVKVEAGSSSVIDSTAISGVGFPDTISVEVCHVSTTELRVNCEVGELTVTTDFYGGKKVGVMKTLAADCVLKDFVSYKTLYSEYTTDQHQCERCQNHACMNCDVDLIQVELIDFPWGGQRCDYCDEVRGTYILQSKKTFTSDPWEKVRCYWQAQETVSGQTVTLTLHIHDDPWRWDAKYLELIMQVNDDCVQYAAGISATFTATDTDCEFKDVRFGIRSRDGTRACAWPLSVKVGTV